MSTKDNNDLGRWRPVLLMWAHAQAATRPGGLLEPSDIVQEVMLEAHRQRDHFRGSTDAEYAAWLRRILTGRIIDTIRAAKAGKRNVDRVESLDAAMVQSSARLETALGMGQSSPSECAMRSEELFRLANALNGLPDAQRQAILLKFAHKHSLDRIAKEMKRTPVAAAGLLKRGLKKLRTDLGTKDRPT